VVRILGSKADNLADRDNEINQKSQLSEVAVSAASAEALEIR